MRNFGSNFFINDKKLEILAFKRLLPIKKQQILLNVKIASSNFQKGQ